MGVALFTFSGTGNSLLLGRKIAAQTVGAELMPAVSLHDGAATFHDADAVGFVFPVYCLDMPDIMREIIDRHDFNGVTYFFAAVTCGGTAGNTLYSLDRKLREKGKRLDYGFEVLMGDNSIVYATSPDVLKRRLDNLDGIASEIAAAVNNRESAVRAYEFNADSANMKRMMDEALSSDYQIGNKSAAKDKCNLCGMCASVCAAGNITITNGSVAWEQRCYRCFACLNWCPQGAIRFGRIEPGSSRQYRCPGITAADIAGQGKRTKQPPHIR